MHGSGIVSQRRETQWKIKLIKFISRLSRRTDKFSTISCFCSIAAGGKTWQGGGEKAVLYTGLLKLGAGLGTGTARKE